MIISNTFGENHSMLTWTKRISTAILTALMFVSFISFGVSASSVNVSAQFTAPAGVTLTYRSLIKKKWEKKTKNQGQTSGTTGKSKKLEAIKIWIKSDTEGGIEYRTRARKKAWGAYKTGGQVSGGKGQRLERIEIKLTGELAEKYDIYYRVHLNFKNGWLDWAKNGETAGNADYAYYIEAIQIVLTEKDAGTPSELYGMKSPRNTAYATAQSIRDAMTAKAQGYSSSTGWLVLTDTNKYFTAVFSGSQGNWKLERLIYCSVGKKSSKTKKGKYSIKKKKKYFYYGKYRCKWASKYKGAYYYHSVLYNRSGKKVLDGRLGKAVSHGCIRMDSGDAKYIYKNVPKKSTVVVY